MVVQDLDSKLAGIMKWHFLELRSFCTRWNCLAKHNDQYWSGRCKKMCTMVSFRDKMNKLAYSMLKRFQAYRDNMGGTNDY